MMLIYGDENSWNKIAATWDTAMRVLISFCLRLGSMLERHLRLRLHGTCEPA